MTVVARPDDCHSKAASSGLAEQAQGYKSVSGKAVAVGNLSENKKNYDVSLVAADALNARNKVQATSESTYNPKDLVGQTYFIPPGDTRALARRCRRHFIPEVVEQGVPQLAARADSERRGEERGNAAAKTR